MEQHIYVTVDAIVFGKIEGRAHILLIKRGNKPYKDSWALPGGFVDDDEDLEPASIRELHEETGLKLDKMQQLYAVGTPRRDPRFRTVSVVYTAHTDPAAHTIIGSDDAKEAKWWDIEKLPPLAFDHAEIINYALKHMSLL